MPGARPGRRGARQDHAGVEVPEIAGDEPAAVDLLPHASPANIPTNEGWWTLVEGRHRHVHATGLVDNDLGALGEATRRRR